MNACCLTKNNVSTEFIGRCLLQKFINVENNWKFDIRRFGYVEFIQNDSSIFESITMIDIPINVSKIHVRIR